MIWIGRVVVFVVATLLSGVMQNIGVRLIRLGPGEKLAEYGGCALIALSTLICLALVWWIDRMWSSPTDGAEPAPPKVRQSPIPENPQ